MKDCYSKYKDKLEFVGIVCKDNEADWKEAVEKYDFPWTQLLNKEQDNLDITYAVEGYPTKVLIDKKGNLVQMFRGESNDFYQKLDELFEE